MFIKYGFDIEVRLWQPTTLITTMDVAHVIADLTAVLRAAMKVGDGA
jgi:hypothetical protein